MSSWISTLSDSSYESEATDGCSIRSVLCGGSPIQKQSRVFNEELRVLVVRAVIGVGVDDQLRIRHVLLHDERVHRGHDHVVTAVHDECWLLDRLQIVVGPHLLDAPLAHRFDLGGRHLVVHLGIAALLPKLRAQLRQEGRDPEVNDKVSPAQVEAMGKWGVQQMGSYDYLKTIKQPTLVVNGSNDVIMPTVNSFIMQQNMPYAQLIVYPDSNHGAHHQYPELFVKHATLFLNG